MDCPSQNMSQMGRGGRASYGNIEDGLVIAHRGLDQETLHKHGQVHDEMNYSHYSLNKNNPPLSPAYTCDPYCLDANAANSIS